LPAGGCMTPAAATPADVQALNGRSF